MNAWNYRRVLWVLSLLGVFVSCDRDTVGLKGQTNASLTFFGATVDQNGAPMAGVEIQYECEAFPADWTYEKRGEPLKKFVVTAKSDNQGRFSFAANVHTLRRLKVEVPTGYRHLYEQHIGGDGMATIPSTYGYLVMSWSDLCYKSDVKHPAVFVFVKDGVKEVSALPCRGGYDSGNGKHWTENKPSWPLEPSLNDVVYNPPSTQP